ncbi:NUDIX hydrolase [Pseudoxanthomonas koreensis]|uniref:NUDIX hydrolase n=1 Tax=Pseudoxanthomonas koreensis TaxID=266061 RepID=UPI001390F3DE|nr:NUDIX hydrolase [Pseudoxanthomonas koreensis]KAF1690633.1 NUDIX hydrolase [Pseudoxanthomonas koreensis]
MDASPGSALPGRDWHPAVTVASVVVRDGRLLLVEERIEGRLVLNQPAGHLDPGESLVQAAVREALEETGWEIAVESFIGAYQWHAPGGQQYLRFAFGATAVAHDPARSLDEGIERAVWLTPAELRARAAEHRSPLVWQVAADWLAGRRQPLSLLQWLP